MRKMTPLLILVLLLFLIFFGMAASTPDTAATTNAPPLLQPNNTCPASIQKGNAGETVKRAQQSLNWWYGHTKFGEYSNQNAGDLFPLTEDGIFGEKTESAVITFQSWVGEDKLDIDGIIGPQSWHALGYC